VGVTGAGDEEVAGGGLRGMVGTSPEMGIAWLAPPSPAKVRQRSWGLGRWGWRTWEGWAVGGDGPVREGRWGPSLRKKNEGVKAGGERR
jgi:hypothetical protein